MTHDPFTQEVLLQLQHHFPGLRHQATPRSRLCIDSRQAEPGDIFIALQGSRCNGQDFIADAVQRGAVLVLQEADRDQLMSADIPCVALRQLRTRLGGWLAAAAHNYAGLQLTGVTGTNGKTSVTHYLAQLYQYCGYESAVIGTVGNGRLGQLQPASHTTPDLIQLHRMLLDYCQSGVQQLAMEVSSHALDQQRTAGIPFSVGVFTNLSRDHLDYHGSMQAYAAAKRRLFSEYGLPLAVLNADDAFSLVSEMNQTDVRCIRYSLHRTDTELFCRDITPVSDGFRLQLDGLWGRHECHLPLLGTFNISNALAASAVLLASGMTAAQVFAGLSRLQSVPGRMQRIVPQTADLPLVVVDYAHTPDALENALLAVKAHLKGRLWCVFGCGGDRDAGKRPLMAEVASRLADAVVLTSDNPRSEPLSDIMDQTAAGLLQPAVLSEPDRQSAIEQTICQAGADDVVLIAGKGHETYQEIQGVRYPFDDVQQAERALALAVESRPDTASSAQGGHL